MRVLYIINDLSYFRAHRERLALDALDDSIEVLVASGGCNEVATKNWNPAIKLIELELEKHQLNVIKDIKLLLALLKIIWQTKPDVVHCFTIKPILIGGLATAAVKLVGRSCKLVWTFAGLGKIYEPEEVSKAPFLLRQLFVSLVLGLTFRLTSAYATFENASDRKTLISKKAVTADRSRTVMGTGLDLNFFSDEDRKERDESQSIRFLLACRLINGKGVNTYLKLASQYKSKTPKPKFMLAGMVDSTNPDAVDMGEIQSAQSEGSIEFIGEVAQKDMPDLLRKTDVFCLPTKLKEGLPRSLLEAAACGVAMIASDQPAMNNIVIPDKTGWLIDPTDINSLKHAVDDAISDQTKTRIFGRNARKNLESLPVNAEAIWQIFKGIYVNR